MGTFRSFYAAVHVNIDFFFLHDLQREGASSGEFGQRGFLFLAVLLQVF